MDKEAETKAIEKWLRMVDKPLGGKKGDKRTQGQEKNEELFTHSMACNSP